MCRNILRFGLRACRGKNGAIRIPHVKRMADGSDAWIVDGQRLSLPGVAHSRRGYGGSRPGAKALGRCAADGI